jgi:sugar/nucleoside kinase (ribokinase family)
VTAPDLIVCGSLTLDNVVTAGGQCLPQAAGGNVVYAALGARIWGARVGLVSRAGANYPQEFLDFLAARGLDLGGVARVDAAHGMNVAFAYRDDGSRVRAFPPDLMARIPPGERSRFTDYTTRGTAHRYATWLDFSPTDDDLPPAWIAAARGAHFAAMPIERHLSLARRLRAARPDMHLQVDSPWYDEREPEHDFHTALLRDIDLLLPSEADLATWRPGQDSLAAAAGLARQAGAHLLVKRGSAGSIVIRGDGLPGPTIPAYRTNAADPTGAGDAFCGGVLAGMMIHGELERAAVCGTVSASFAVEAAGIGGLLGAGRDEAERRFCWVAERLTILRGLERNA